MRSANELEVRLAGLFNVNGADAGSINTAFAQGGAMGTSLGKQRYDMAHFVARFVAGRWQVRGTRQIFFVHMSGFETHADHVTLFTESDFGRTFAPNSSAGTDHVRGNGQLIMGSGRRPRHLRLLRRSGAGRARQCGPQFLGAARPLDPDPVG